nr:hypothetical protein TetV2_00378 [Oceanusvirus sp.]
MIDKAIPIAFALTAAAAAANKAFPKVVVRKRLTSVFYKLGVIMTFGMSKSSTLGPVWNKTVEPVFVDLLENVSYAVHHGLVEGLKSDNAPEPPMPQMPPMPPKNAEDKQQKPDP